MYCVFAPNPRLGFAHYSNIPEHLRHSIKQSINPIASCYQTEKRLKSLLMNYQNPSQNQN